MSTAFNSIKRDVLADPDTRAEYEPGACVTMHNPARPGELLTGWLDDLSVSVPAFAAHIGINRVMLSRVLHCHAAVSADMDLAAPESLAA